MFGNWSFKKKLQIAIGALSLVSILTSGFLTYKLYNDSISMKAQLLGEAADGIADKIDRNLFERFGDVQAFALSEPARSGDPDRITKFMNDMMAAYAPIYDVMLVLDKKGNVVAINKVDKKGNPLDTSAVKGKNFSDKDWFKNCVENKIQPGQAYYTDLYTDTDIGNAVKSDGKIMTFAAPIRDAATGEILGVWSNQMSWNDVVKDLIVNESGKLVNDRFSTIVPNLLNSKGDFLHHIDTNKILNGKDSSAENFLSGKSSRASEMVDERERINDVAIKAYSRELGFSSYPGKGWTVTLQVPKSDKFIRESIMLSITGLLALVVIAGFTVFVAQGTSGSLEKIISRLEIESGKVSTNASEVTTSAHSLSESATEQASALQETAASIEEINAMIKKSSENSTRSRQVAENSSEIAKRGQESVEEMSHAINEINVSNEAVLKQIDASNNQITDIARVIAEIGEKTKVINDIVFQTKLLSFNASVEAARAGEHGKGFAVVAEEVGNLAQMSGNAAKEISEMLTESIKNVENTVSESKRKVEGLISEGRQKLRTGITIADQCSKILNDVVINVNDLAIMVAEIGVASQEQSQGVSEITRAMHELDQTTHANATTSQKVSGNANSLSDQADQMNQIVSELLQVVVGKTDHSYSTGAMNESRKSPNNLIDLAKVKSTKLESIERIGKASGDDVPSSDDPGFKDV